VAICRAPAGAEAYMHTLSSADGRFVSCLQPFLKQAG
jgi:hypothetical protein